MAVTSTRQRRARTFGVDDSPGFKALRVYLVTCDDPTDGPEAAAATVPQRGAGYSLAYPGLTVQEIDAQAIDGTNLHYEVTVNYGTKSRSGSDVSNDPEQQDPDPTERPPIVRLSFDTYEEQASLATAEPDAVDSDGTAINPLNWRFKKAIVNSAGRPFDPSITRVWRDPVVTITKNVDILPWTLATTYIDTVNSDQFTINYRSNTYTVAAGQAWLYEFSSEPQYENGTQYETVTVVLKIRADGWKKKVLDQGLEEAGIGGDWKVRPIRDQNGDPIQAPALLDGKGARLTSSAKPVWLRFPMNATAVFGTILADFLGNES